MSMLRNVLTYMGLGPDEDYDDGYLYDGPDQGARTPERPTSNFDEPVIDEDDVNRPDPHAVRERPKWLARAEVEPTSGDADVASTASSRADRNGHGDTSVVDDLIPESVGDGAESEVQADAARPSPSVRAELRSRAAERPLRAVPPTEVGQTDLVQPENGITVRAVPTQSEADMTTQTRGFDTGQPARRAVAPRTLAPETFGEAKVLADEFKAEVPVVMNLRSVDRELARRLIDFASGICYALDGSMEKLAPQVFLLTPRRVEVSDADRRWLEQRGYDT